VLIPEARRPILSHDPSRCQNQLRRARRGYVSKSGRKGPRERRFCGGSLDGLPHPDNIWLFRRTLVARRSPTASVDMGLLAALRVRAPCGCYPVEVPSAPNNNGLLRILGFLPESRRDGKVSSFMGWRMLLD
jgi:hypothetical protein